MSRDDEPRGAAVEVTGDAGGGVVSLEVRWIHPGRLPALLAERLEPFAEGIEVREDRYLTDPVLADVSVKIRGGVRLDVKAFRHSPGRLVASRWHARPARAVGEVERPAGRRPSAPD